jgi:hypothetical protein
MSPIQEEVLHDPELHDAYERLERERRLKKRGAAAGLLLAAASLIVATYLAYARAPDVVTFDRFGQEVPKVN